MGDFREIPFNDLRPSHDELRAEFHAALDRVMTHGEFILGREALAFEGEWARFTGAKHAIGCANGTDALILALQALGIAAGDEVIAPAYTFIATIESIIAVGAKPVLADVDPASGLLLPSEIARLSNSRTRAVIPVHLYGALAPMDGILTECRRRKLRCVEDAAQAHGSAHGLGSGKIHAGLFGDAGTFSFFPGKNLGALGDAGAIVTEDDALATRLRKLRDHGRASKYLHDEFGWNMRLDGLQAALLSVKLKHLSRWNANRAQIAAVYRRGLADVAELALPPEPPMGADYAVHLFVVRYPRRDWLVGELARVGVDARVHYPTPCHLQPAWLAKYGPERLPGAEQLALSCLSLPLSGTMSLEDAEEVVRRLRRIVVAP